MESPHPLNYFIECVVYLEIAKSDPLFFQHVMEESRIFNEGILITTLITI